MIVFVATTVGTYLMVGIDGRTLDAIAPDAQEADTITLLNYVVTGMIALFAAIMVVNSLVAATSVRGAEFRRLGWPGPSRARSAAGAHRGRARRRSASRSAAWPPLRRLFPTPSRATRAWSPTASSG